MGWKIIQKEELKNGTILKNTAAIQNVYLPLLIPEKDYLIKKKNTLKFNPELFFNYNKLEICEILMKKYSSNLRKFVADLFKNSIESYKKICPYL